MNEKIKIPEHCLYCEGKEITKRGFRKKKLECIQLWYCKKCEKTFTPQPIKNNTFPLKIILDGISHYNMGFLLKDSCKFLREQYGITIPITTLNHWVEEHKDLCRYHRIRKLGVKLFTPNQIIPTANLYHRQVYKFRIHRAKLTLLLQEDVRHQKFKPLKKFLEMMLTQCPHHLFKESARASEIKTKFSLEKVLIRSKKNFANRIARLLLQTVSDNRQRHEALQKFMIVNDSVTVATEIPIYLLPEDIEHMESQLGFEIPIKIIKALTGHIDFIQIRNGAIHILDYKPNAAKQKPIEQLTLYALAMSRLTGLRMFEFKCAWFDEKDYFEFFPLHTVHKLKKA